MDAIRLKNGTEEVSPLVTVTMLALRNLIESDPMALYEMAMICRDPSHELFGNASERLQGLALLQSDGRPHQSIRNIVLSAVVGNGLDMTLGNPVA